MNTPIAANRMLELPDTSANWIEGGTAAYRNASLALFLAGFASFSLLYCVQPLLPLFSAEFHVSPASSALALSLTTGLLALSILATGAFSQMLGRRGLMFGSMVAAAALNIIAALTPSWNGLLLARAAEGIVLGGVPAVAMAYLAEEIAPGFLGKAMGLYVAGTAFGGMMGRVGMGALTEFTSWRSAMILEGSVGLACAAGFGLLLPRSRHFVAQRGFDLGFHLRAWGRHLVNPRLLRLYTAGFLLMSVFVTLFNYSTYRLIAPPYRLSQTAISMIFLCYAFGIVSSSVAGWLGDHIGRRPVFVIGFLLILAGIALTLASPLLAIIAGIALVTTGFFVGHSIASGSVGLAARSDKGHAASLYLLFYYVGSSVVGSAGGWFWQHGGWNAVAALTGVLALAGIGLGMNKGR